MKEKGWKRKDGRRVRRRKEYIGSNKELMRGASQLRTVAVETECTHPLLKTTVTSCQAPCISFYSTWIIQSTWTRGTFTIYWIISFPWTSLPMSSQYLQSKSEGSSTSPEGKRGNCFKWSIRLMPLHCALTCHGLLAVCEWPWDLAPLPCWDHLHSGCSFDFSADLPVGYNFCSFRA